MSKFKIEDKVRIVKYGHLYWINKNPIIGTKPTKPYNTIHEDCTTYWVDMQPELIGKEDIIMGSYYDLYGHANQPKDIIEREKKQYSLVNSGSWFNENQLELVEANNVLTREKVIEVIKSIP